MDELDYIHILVIEDNKDTARMLAVLLERRFSATVDLAASCAEAREMLARSTYDAVTLDYQLPDGSGLDMLDEIASVDGHPPVIMITGHGDEELAYLSFRMGASGYAAKDRKLSVVLPDAIEWAMADARLKKEHGQAVADMRLEGLIEATHSMSRDIRIELDGISQASQKLEVIARRQGNAADLAKAVSAIENSLSHSYSLMDKIDELVEPKPRRKGSPEGSQPA